MDLPPQKKNKVQPPRNYLQRKEQYRLLALVMLFGLVVVVFFEARKPENWENWEWFQALSNDEPAEEESGPDDYDTSYQPTLKEPAPADTVRIIPPAERERAATERNLFPGVVPVYLDEIEDNSPHQPVEAYAWFNLLHVLSINEADFIDKSSSGEVTFLQLFKQPEAYRGELVTVRGTVHQIEWHEAGANRYEIPGYWRLVIRLKDSEPRVVFAYVLDKPEGLPESPKLHEEIDLTGFFYKNWVYQRRDGHSEIAPVVLAKTLSWQPEVAAVPLLSGSWLFAAAIGVGVGILLLSILSTLGIYFGSNRYFREPYGKAHTNRSETLPDFAEDEVLPPPEESLHQLAQE